MNTDNNNMDDKQKQKKIQDMLSAIKSAQFDDDLILPEITTQNKSTVKPQTLPQRAK